MNNNNEVVKNTDDVTVKKKISITDLFQHTWFILLTLFVAVLIVSAVIILIVMNTQNLTLGEVFGFKVKRIDFENDPLDKYVVVEKSDYENIEVDLNIRRPDEMDVSDKKVQALASAAIKSGLDFGGRYQYTEPIGAGDKIYFYYAAYLVDENGNRIKEISGLNNCKNSSSSNFAEFIVGGGDFSFIYKSRDDGTSGTLENYEEVYIHGFESGLIGAVPNSYKFYTVGEVRDTDIVYATATYIDSDGLLYDRVNLRIDLSDADLENKWGEGVKNYITENKIGYENKNVESFVRLGDGSKLTFTNFTVDYIVRGEEAPITVKTVFPYDYSDESLRNKTVYFDLYIEKTLCYKTPEFNDEFVLKTLGLTEKKLAKYEGETISEKCENYYLQMLLKEYEANRAIIAETLIWEKLKQNVEIVKMPEKEIQYDYNDYVYLYQWACEVANENGAGYESFDEYMTEMLGLELGAYWNVYVWDWIEDTVLEKLIFYSILRSEGLLSDTESYEAFCNKEIESSYQLETGKDRDDFDTDKAYEDELASYRAEKVYECGGEDGFKNEMYYRYVSEMLIEVAVLNDVAN